VNRQIRCSLLDGVASIVHEASTMCDGRRIRGLAALLAGILAAGCHVPLHLPVEPGATFALHENHGQFVVDHLGSLPSPEVTLPGWFRAPGAASYLLESGGQAIAAFWMAAPGAVNVRATTDKTGPITGAVEPSWQDGAIQLTLRPAKADAVHTGTFVSTEPASVLSRNLQTVLDIRRSFRADVLDVRDAPVGWIRVRIGPYQDAARIYDGALPPTVPNELAAAVAIALGSELDWIQAHAINVYQSDTGETPLERSVPVH
jgi:hypothetical protein